MIICGQQQPLCVFNPDYGNIFADVKSRCGFELPRHMAFADCEFFCEQLKSDFRRIIIGNVFRYFPKHLRIIRIRQRAPVGSCNAYQKRFYTAANHIGAETVFFPVLLFYYADQRRKLCGTRNIEPVKASEYRVILFPVKKFASERKQNALRCLVLGACSFSVSPPIKNYNISGQEF